MTVSFVRYLNIILVAVLSGVSLGIWVGFNPSHLSALTYIEQQQNMLRSLKTLLIALVVTATLMTIFSAFLQKTNRSTFKSLLIAAFFLIVCLLITRFGNKPMDDLVLTWTKDSIPSNWEELRDKWWSFHILRSLAEILAFLIITWTSIKKESNTSL